MGSVYDAPLQRIDFGNQEAAREQINAWVAENTRDKITAIVPPGLPSPDTPLTLANAIYFKASWQASFQDARTPELG